MTDQVFDTRADDLTEMTDLLLLIGTTLALVAGVVLSIFSISYIEDMETLRNVKDVIWNFACGRPIESSVILPLLLTFATLSFITAGVLGGVQAWRSRTKRKRGHIET